MLIICNNFRHKPHSAAGGYCIKRCSRNVLIWPLKHDSCNGLWIIIFCLTGVVFLWYREVFVYIYLAYFFIILPGSFFGCFQVCCITIVLIGYKVNILPPDGKMKIKTAFIDAPDEVLQDKAVFIGHYFLVWFRLGVVFIQYEAFVYCLHMKFIFSVGQKNKQPFVVF